MIVLLKALTLTYQVKERAQMEPGYSVIKKRSSLDNK
jgi:hypothetical protein